MGPPTRLWATEQRQGGHNGRQNGAQPAFDVACYRLADNGDVDAWETSDAESAHAVRSFELGDGRLDTRANPVLVFPGPLVLFGETFIARPQRRADVEPEVAYRVAHIGALGAMIRRADRA